MNYIIIEIHLFIDIDIIYIYTIIHSRIVLIMKKLITPLIVALTINTALAGKPIEDEIVLKKEVFSATTQKPKSLAFSLTHESVISIPSIRSKSLHPAVTDAMRNSERKVDPETIKRLRKLWFSF